MDDDYQEFLARKAVKAPRRGLDQVPDLAAHLFHHQRLSVAHALTIGGAGCFLDTGLGKTEVQLEYLRHAMDATNGRGLMLVPLAVAQQAKRRADRWGYEARVIRDGSEAGPGINIINYDRIDRIDVNDFGAVALDEASILKSFTGKTTRLLIDLFRGHRFKMVATATPAPNDHMELGNYAEFLGIMKSSEMLMRWFITDQSKMGKYIIKGHAQRPFWDWMASWARMAQLPSDLGGDDTGYDLPPLQYFRHKARSSEIKTDGNDLFANLALSATTLHTVKRQTSEARAEMIAAVVANEPNQRWVIWCDTDYEADAIHRVLPDALEVRGSMPIDRKEDAIDAFSTGQARVLITKPSLCGFGLDWSHCARMAFVGRSYSYETFYQAVRRCHRFGQTRPVHVHIAVAEGEAEIGRVIDRKAEDQVKMRDAMRAAMLRATGQSSQVKVEYQPTHKGNMPKWLTA